MDTLFLDSLSIIPGTEVVQRNGKILDSSYYSINYVRSYLLPRSKDSVDWIISYRVFPIAFDKSYSKRSLKILQPEDIGLYDYYNIKTSDEKENLFDMAGLNKNGSISRGITFGNNQDLSVNSNLNLQLSGKITEDINILAAITDDNIPIQAEGNTQQLQEFDQVFIQLYNEKYKLIAGDFLLSRPQSYFMNFTKKAQGGSFSAKFLTSEEADTSKNGHLHSSVSIAVSKGKFSRNLIDGIEGNQGPYRLTGANGEQFIIVLSGTELVYVDGKLLKRGQEFDYMIDYNSAELSFTPNFLITKDQRIVVEFQYSERNYARSLMHFESNYKKEKLRLNFNLFSEQDNKNQPLLQELETEEKELLRNVGDDLNSAVIPAVDSVAEFLDDQVLYKMVDSLGFDSVLIYSIHPDSAKFRARFSYVGPNNGNYVRIRSTANGKVYEWKQPVGGIPQGDYEPLILLISPKQQQMLTFGGTYHFSQNTLLSLEGAFTNNDLNTFSKRHSEDNRSYGIKANFSHSQSIGRRENKTDLWNSKLIYEQRGKNFTYIERYRSVEFERDWNTQGMPLYGNEYLINASTGIAQKDHYLLNYHFDSFVKGHDYKGLRNGYNASYKNNGFKLESRGSYLTAEAALNSEFLRHYTTIEQKLGAFTLGLYTEQEQILFYESKSDSLTNSSKNRLNYSAYLEILDSNKNNFYRLNYSQFYDYLPSEKELRNTYVSDNFEASFELLGNPKSRLKGVGVYRQLKIKDPLLAEQQGQKPENTVLGRLDYDLKLMKGLLSSNSYYQVGSGLENRKEFSYLEVPDGQGNFVYRDYNGNGIKELNEFEEAGPNNRFEANYIKVFTPTNEFQRVFTNQFSEILFLRPEAIWNNEKGLRKAISKFSNKTAFRVDKKTVEESDIYNPFKDNVQDSALVSINSSLSNTFYFNRLSTKFGLEIFYLNNKGKTLLINGFESREIDQKEVRARYNLTRIYTLEAKVSTTEKFNGSEYFENRNYNIVSKEAEPTFIYQPSVKFRWSLNAIYAEKENENGTEKSINRTVGSEIEFNEAGKGSISVGIDFVNIDFNSDGNSSLAFEMLEGLQEGHNTIWNISWQRNLSNNLQLNLNYNGRSSEDLRTIHSGGMQVRAFF